VEKNEFLDIGEKYVEAENVSEYLAKAGSVEKKKAFDMAVKAKKQKDSLFDPLFYHFVDGEIKFLSVRDIDIKKRL